MKYGYFDDQHGEYVITNPQTPVKWTNYLGSLKFGGLVDHTGGGLLCAGDPAFNRILKYIPQMPDSDFKGQTAYIRVKEGGSYRVFSPFYVPTMDEYDAYTCRVGLSYQVITSTIHGITTEVTIFIPPGGTAELRQYAIRNDRYEPVELDLVPVVEYSHFDALKQFTNADWVPQTMMTDAEWEKDGYLVLKQYPFMRRGVLCNYFSANKPADSFQSDRRAFLGANGYGSWKQPLELFNEHLGNIEARRGDNIAAIVYKAGTLAPGESFNVTTILGQDTPDQVRSSVARYRDKEGAQKALADLKNWWTTYLDAYSCETPSESFNTMVNVHNPRQCYMTFNWSRYLSLYQLGLGARGLGYRDSSQDIMGVLMSVPKDARGLLEKILSVQNPDGSAMHQFYPATMEANEGDSREEGNKRVYGDDHLWAVMAVCAYLRETGDYDFLSKQITFYDKEKALPERESGTVLDHLQRALAYTKTHVGRHGIPLLGFADWNDTMNLPGEAESLMVANLYGYALKEIITLMQHLGETDEVDEYLQDYKTMSKTVNEHGWDGDWYIRYFTEDGQPIGSIKNREGKIFTNGQSWPVISGFAPKDRAQSALKSVQEWLNTSNGIKLSTPGYNQYDPEIGGVTTYPPGAKENGGIFLHSNPWVIIAETMMGNGDRAFEYYEQINPAAKNDIIDQYEVEPYCYAQNILGDEHPQFGLGRNSWLSGTASWTYQAVGGSTKTEPCDMLV